MSNNLIIPDRPRKKSRRMGQVNVVSREEYAESDLNTRVELIKGLIPIGLMEVAALLQEEVEQLTGGWHARKGDAEAGVRYGSNPGSVRLGGQRIPVRVPRVRGDDGEIPLQSYRSLHAGSGEVDDALLKRVLYGVSCRNYESAAEAIPGAIGLSSSTVSRSFVAASAAQLKKFNERDLSGEEYVAIFLDGKSFAGSMMVIALGITIHGKKRPLGFVETDTENKKVITRFLRSLLARGLDVSKGILVIIDGAKGLRAGVKAAFSGRVVVQRCAWHKRENVVSYLPKADQASWSKRLQRAMDRPTYKEAYSSLQALLKELDDINQSAADSLREGFEELLTLHRLGLFAQLGRSFKTTNCLENVNSLLEKRCGKVNHWKNSNQRHRWVAAALLDIEPRFRTVCGFNHLPALREAVGRELKIKKTAAAVSKAA